MYYQLNAAEFGGVFAPPCVMLILKWWKNVLGWCWQEVIYVDIFHLDNFLKKSQGWCKKGSSYFFFKIFLKNAFRQNSCFFKQQ